VIDLNFHGRGGQYFDDPPVVGKTLVKMMWQAHQQAWTLSSDDHY